MNKKGAEKYYIIINLILGLIVVAIVMYFLFHEYFTTNDINWETCRQSIVLRQTIPNNYGVEQIKAQFPLKCKTQTIDIGLNDEKNINKIVSDTREQCWNLFGEGKYTLYSANYFSNANYCFICAHIKFSDALRNENKVNQKLYGKDWLIVIDSQKDPGWSRGIDKVFQIFTGLNPISELYGRKMEEEHSQLYTIDIDQISTLTNQGCEIVTIPA